MFSTRRVSLNSLSIILLKVEVVSFFLSPSHHLLLCRCFVNSALLRLLIILLKKLHLKLRSQMCRNDWKVLYYSSKAFHCALGLILFKIYILLAILYLSKCNDQPIYIHTLTRIQNCDWRNRAVPPNSQLRTCKNLQIPKAKKIK